MGCGSSKDRDVDLTDLAPNRPGQPGQDYEHDVDLTPDNLEDALQLMASYITGRRRELSIVVVGGVVSTMLLRTRDSTQDIDFFSEQLSREDAKLLMEASQHVRQQLTDPRLGSGWFNNMTTFFINSRIRAQLVAEGLAQNAVVFQSPGLTLLAAPWAYQFCAKVHRMAGGGRKGHDAGDAAGYLYQFLTSQNMQTISADEIGQLLERYQIQGIDRSGLLEAFQAINEAFAARYGNANPIVQ